ncbi:MAG: hypothetical protein IJ111_15375, partial [Eggerthellaceae bacterium]|nr:hypothetical protein [Eggerthellaceae bacterium]
YHFRLTQSEYDYASFLCSVSGLSRSNLYRLLVLLGPYPYYESVTPEIEGFYSMLSIPFMHVADQHKFSVEFIRQNTNIKQALRRCERYFRGNYSYRSEQALQLKDSLQEHLYNVIERISDCADVLRESISIAFTDANTKELSTRQCGFACEPGIRELLQLKADVFEVYEGLYLKLALRVFEETCKGYFVQKRQMHVQGVEVMPSFFVRVLDPESVLHDLTGCGKSFNSAVHFMNAFFDAPGMPS